MQWQLILIALALGAGALAATPDEIADRQAAQQRLMHDWGGLIRYGSENTELPQPKPGEDRVVFLGDDITENWQAFFPGKPYLNRGIERQTSSQMLLRFRQDVISLKPKVVIIQAGSNDLAGLTGPATQPMIAENIMSMVELAKANGIKVVLASVTPICDCGSTRQTQKRAQGKIIGLNGWLKEYAAETGSVYLDYYGALAAGRNLKADFTTDGFLLNDSAYKAMTPLAEKAIAQALAKQEN
jgi:lysophospholipase L1-like esterase